MPTYRTGYPDTLHSSRLQHLTGTAYPAVPTGLFLALFTKMPLSDGTGAVEVTGTRPSITLGAPIMDYNSRQYITNASPISATLVNASAGQIVGFGIFGAATGGTLYYADRLPSSFQVSAGQAVTIPANGIKVYAEPPTI